jgi:hypothetical protein
LATEPGDMKLGSFRKCAPLIGILRSAVKKKKKKHTMPSLWRKKSGKKQKSRVLAAFKPSFLRPNDPIFFHGLVVQHFQ